MTEQQLDENNNAVPYGKLKSPQKCYPCSHEGCRYSSSRKGHLETHMAIHAATKCFNCRKCSRSFSTLCNLNQHNETHRTFIGRCHLCNYESPTCLEFVNHLDAHNDERAHTCEECRKIFSKMTSFFLHLSNHFVENANEVIYCPLCSRAFTRIRMLGRHLLV